MAIKNRNFKIAAVLVLGFAFIHWIQGEQEPIAENTVREPAAVQKVISATATEPAQKVVPNSIVTSKIQTQEDLFISLQSTSQKPWRINQDAFTGRVRTLHSGQIALPGDTPLEKANEFIRRFSMDVFDVDPENLEFKEELKAARVKLLYQQTISGTPVFGGNLAIIFENGEITRVQNDLTPAPKTELNPPAISLEDAFAMYLKNPTVGFSRDKRQESLNQIELIQSKDRQPKLMLYSKGTSLTYVYSFYIKGTDANQNVRRRRVLFDPSANRVVLATVTEIK